MFGRLSQLAQNVQNSFNADESEGSPSRGSSDSEKTIARLQADLEQAEEQNKSINAAFKKLLKEKEQEIRALKEQTATTEPSVKDASAQEDKNADLELINQLRRKNEEYQMLVGQKDETIQMLMTEVKEAEDLKDKVEKQERINTEKLMFELAERIRAHENIQRKLEETKHVMTEKDNAIHNMADQMAAQDELLKAKDDSIKKLKRMAAGNETSEDMIVTLQKAVQEKDNRLSQMAQLVDKLEVEKKVLDAKINNRDGLETSKDQTIKTLWSEIEQKNEIIEKISSEKEELMSTIHKKEEELKNKMDLINEKDTVVDDLVVKVRSLEKELSVKHSDIEVSSEGASREIGHLKDQLAELNEILKSKTQTIDMFQKEIEEKDSAHFELRQKALALQKAVEDKDEELQEMSQSNKKLIKERDEFKEICEKQETEKGTLKEELNAVGRELSQQLDEEAQKVSELMSKLNESENERARIKKEMESLVEDLAICKESQSAILVELDSERGKATELEKSMGDLEKEAADKSEALERMKRNLEAAGEELKTKTEEIDLRNREMQTQRERFDAELSFLQSTSENEKGNAANLLKEMEQIRRDLDTAIQERRHFENQTIALKRGLEDRETQLEEMHLKVNKSLEDNSKLREIVSALEDRVRELSDVEKLNESLRADIAEEVEKTEEAKQISLDFGKECEKMKKDVDAKGLALEEKQRYLQKLEEENVGLREEGKKLGLKLEVLLEEKMSMESEKEQMKKQDEDLNVKLSSMKSEYLGLNEKVVEMEEALNHMVEKLNTAELKMNESLHEKDALEEKLRLILEERSVLASQKSDIETALEEFVRSTESRKKRSGRSSVDGSEGARSTPNEGLSGYSTPVSKEGSPRNSAFLDSFQPTLQSQVTVGNLFEGKAISEIFRLVEEERKALEANLASATKEKDTIAARNSDLEDYLDLEKQKFKQASEEISLLQQKFAETEDNLNQYVHSLKEELSALRYANDELELRVQQDSEALDSNRRQLEQLESALRRTEDQLAEKALELTRMTESSDQMQTELGSKEDQLEKTTKQNKQLKVKLKEILKERTEREKSAHEKEARIAELEPLSDKLNESLSKVEKLETGIIERDSTIESLEQERSEKAAEFAALETKISDLEDDTHRLREMSAHEVYAANEKAAELEKSFRELDDINKVLKGDVDTKAHEIEDLGSILSVHKEELVSMKQMLLQKDEEIAMMRGNVDMLEQSKNELSKEFDQERNELETFRDNVDSLKSSLVESEEVIKALKIEVAEKAASLVEISKEFDTQKCQNLNQTEYISKLEGDVSEINNKLLSTKQELAHAEETNQAMISKVNLLEQEIIALRESIAEREDNIAKVLSENEKNILQSQDDLSKKEKEILSLANQKESLQSKLNDLEVLLLDKDEGLKDIVNVKNSELGLLRDEKQALNLELLDAKKSTADYQQKLKQLENDLTGQLAVKETDILQKASEIADLTSKSSDGALLLDNLQQQLRSAQEDLGQVTEVSNTQRRELEEKSGECLSLERTLEDVKVEKLNLVKDLGVKESEIDELKKQVALASEKVQNLTEELVTEKRAFEEQRNIMEQNKDDSGSQIENLLTKINELIQEKNDLLKSSNSLQLDLETRGKALSDSDSRIEHIIAEKEELKQQLDGVYLQLEEKDKEVDDKLQKLQASEENSKRILEDREELSEKILSYEEQMKQFEIQSIENVKSLNDDLSVKEEELATVRAELENVKEREKNLSNLAVELEKSVSEKDEELRVSREEVRLIDKLQRDLEESYKEKEQLGARHEKASEKCDNLEKEIELLQKEMERSDKEFEAERDIFAAKISDLSADIEKRSQMETESRLELERIRKEASSKDELIALKSEELEVSKSMTEKLEKEEILKLQEEISEKNKKFEEYKGKVLKKMKSMKEELKKLNERNDELTGKEELLSKIELEIENQRSEQLYMQSTLSETKSELETVKEERQDLMFQLESHRQKIVEMENFNVSREENMRNFETELVRYQRLLQDKDEEGSAIKELMRKSMEEMQVLQDKLHKKEERVKILQEQLIANEEDFVTSFTEKEKDIEGLKEKLREVESAFAEKEIASSDLLKNMKHLEEEAIQLKSACHDMNLELQAANEEKGNTAGENSKLLEKVDMLAAQVEKVTTEKDSLEEEIARVREELAVMTNDVSLKNEEVEQLRGEMTKITAEQMQNSSKEELSYSEEYVALKDEKESLQRSLDNMAEKNKLLEMECKEKSAEIDLLIEQLQERSNDVERLRSKEDVNFEEVIRPYVEQISELQDTTEKKKKAFDEYKAKVAKRMKALKEENISLQAMTDELNSKLEDEAVKSSESFLGLERENESMNSRIAEMQQVVNVSVKEVEEFQSIASASQADADSVRHELGRIKQRLCDKEDEIMTVKDMMRVTMNEMQTLQEELNKKDEEIEKFKTSEDTLNNSMVSLNEELASIKEEYNMKIADYTAMKNELLERNKQIEVLSAELVEKNANLDQLKVSLPERSGDVIPDVRIMEDQLTELEKESEGVKLKLAKAIKRISTMRKELQSKEDILKTRDEEIAILRKSSEELKEQNGHLQCEINEVKARIADQAQELQKKGVLLQEPSSKTSYDPKIEETVIPSMIVSVTAEHEDGWGDVSSVDGGDLGSLCQGDLEVVTKREESVHVESKCDSSVDESQRKEIEVLQKEREEISENLKKSTEQVEKAKKKMAVLKKADIKRGKEIEELRVALSDLGAQKEDEIGKLVERINDLNNKLNEKEEQVTSLTLKSLSVNSDLEEAVKLKDKILTTNEDLKKLVEVMAEEKHELDDEMKDMLSEIKDVMDIKNKLVMDLGHMKEALERKEKECCQLGDMLSEKEEKLAANEWKLQELESLEKDLANSIQERNRLNEELTTSVVKLDGLEDILKARENEVRSLNEEILKMKDCDVTKEELISELQCEILKKEDVLKELPNKEGIAVLHHRIESLEEDLRLKQDDLATLNATNQELVKALNEEKSIIHRLEEEYLAKQSDLTSQLESQQLRIEEYEAEIGGLQEAMTLSLEKIEKGEMLESLNTELQQKLDDQVTMMSEYNTVIAEKNEEIKTLSLKFQEKEEEVNNLSMEIVSKHKQTEILSDSERNLFQSTIDELRQNKSQSEEFLQEEIQLLKDRLDKESELMNEKSRIEHDELVKSFEQKTQTVDELALKVEKLNETIEHKDTVIAKLKLKLKHTIKDRDVMKGNLQSEIERISHEKDVVFNEFQAKAQQTENDMQSLKNDFAAMEKQHSKMKAEKDEILRGLEEKLRLLSLESDEVKEKSAEATSRISSLEDDIAGLRQELGDKEEVIEKYEWENSEKEDKIRDLERDARFFEGRKAEWEELKQTFEDTIEVKERIMEKLQKEIEENQSQKIMNSREKEDKLIEIEKRYNEMENDLKMKETRIKGVEEELLRSEQKVSEFLEAKLKIFEMLGESTEDAMNEEDVCSIIAEYKTSLEKILNSKEEELSKLEREIDILSRGKSEFEEEARKFKEEVDVEMERILHHLDGNLQLAEDRSLRTITELIISEVDVYKNQNKELEDSLMLMKESSSRVEMQVRELPAKYEDDDGRREAEKESIQGSQDMKNQEKNDSQDRELEVKCNELRNETLYLKEELAKKLDIIENCKHENARIEKRASEDEHMLDLAKLEIQQVTIDRENVERQLEILMQESESLKSSTLPEMQTLISAKNKAMLELRENFSEVISDKDSIIDTLRTKISELQQSLLEGNFQSQEEIDALKGLITQRDEHLARVERDLASTKRSHDLLQSELSKTITEKDSIGGSIQDQFENISKGLRGDIELFMEDKRTFEMEFQLERLQLERTIAEQRSEIEDLRKIISGKDKEVYELNFVVAELRRRVEDAADILSKEDYYHQLEERIEASHEKVRVANAAVRDIQDRLREEKGRVEDLEMRLDISNGEKGEVVLVYEGKIQKIKDDHSKVYQSLKSELQEMISKNAELESSFESKIEEATRNYQFEEQRLREMFGKEREELTRRTEELVKDVERLEKEKIDTMEEAITEVLTNADEKMLKLKDDYENIVADKNYRIKEFAERIEYMQARLDSLSESNTNLSKSLFVLENENMNLKKEATSLSNIYQLAVTNHKKEIENLLVKKGSEFKSLRSQFEEALEEKEKIFENLREKLKGLHEELEFRFQENNELNSEKEKLLQENITKDLMYEKLKINVDSLLSSVFEISRTRSELQKYGGENEKLEESAVGQISDRDKTLKLEEKIPKDSMAKGFEAAISEAKIVVDSHILSRKDTGRTEEHLKEENSKLRTDLKIMEEENSRLSGVIESTNETNEKLLIQQNMERESLENHVRNLETDNAKLQAIVAQFDSNGTKDLNAQLEVVPSGMSAGNDEKDEEHEEHKEDESVKKPIEEDITPVSYVELQATNDEKQIKGEMLVNMEEELALLKADNERLEKTRKEIELNVRSDFDDILQNLREDLQNALNENKSLMNENFMLKNVRAEKESEESVKNDVTCQTTEGLPVSDSTEISNNQSHVADRSSSLEAFAQTDVSFVYQTLEDSNRDSSLGETARIKQYGSSDRLPEVVEDSLYSKMSFENLQTFSDSTLDVESLTGHAKLELRLGEDAEDGDKFVNVADMQNEVEKLNAKLQQSKKMILKLKQMTKKYKTELNELQAEKFEQVRVYEDAVNATKQELEESNLEKVRKDQEIRSLREEVRLLVKEKADFGDAIKARIDGIIADHAKMTAELTETKDRECEQKDEVIRMLYNLKSENKSKIEQLTNQLNQALIESDTLRTDNERAHSKLHEEMSKAVEKSDKFEELRARFQDVEMALTETEEKRANLAEKLNVTKNDAMVDNARFDEEIIEKYAEETDRTNVELKEAFDLIRALENNQRDLEEEIESRVNELNIIIDTHKLTIERMSSEKVEIEKSMQEMREVVKQVVEEKDSLVGYWKNENSRLIEESERKFNENVEVSQRNIEECQAEILALRGQVDAQAGEIETLQEQLNTAEASAREFAERTDGGEILVVNLRSELARALEEKSLLEDKIEFFDHQVDTLRNEHGREVQMHQGEIEKLNIVVQDMRITLHERDQAITRLESEKQSLNDEINKGKKKIKRWKRELETSKKSNQELTDIIRLEMEQVLSEIQDEKASLYSDVLSKDKQLQELRIHADQLVHEREQWNSRLRSSGPIESDVLVGNADINKVGFTDKERLSMQVNQLKAEKDEIVAGLESKILQLKNDYDVMEKSKREGDLKMAELQARLNHLLKQDHTRDKSYQRDKLENYESEVRSLKGDIELLKQEANGLAGSSKMLFGQMEKEITSLLMGATPSELHPVPQTVSSVGSTDLGNLSPTYERLSDNSSELEEAKERITMLEDSLQTWKERCSELEEQLEQGMISEVSGRRGSQEFLINIDDEGPSIEAARPTFGEKALRLTKYSTSGISFKTRARSFFSSFMSKQRGMLPVRRIFLMVYIMAVHILAVMSLYGLLHG